MPENENLAIRDLDHLKELAGREDGVECFIMLNGGARSSKRIRYYPNGGMTAWDDAMIFDDAGETNYRDGLEIAWHVDNEIDDSECDYTTDAALLRYSNIGRALDFNALIAYGNSC